MEIFKEFDFQAAHSLPHLPPGHKCRNLHGHSYRLRVTVRGPIDPAIGWVMDFDRIKQACKPVIDRLDHAFLNEIPGLEISTCERVAQWIWRQIAPHVPGLAAIELWETATSGCTYRGEHE